MPGLKHAENARNQALPIKALSTFVTLSRSERFADAAAEAGVSVSAISHQIRSLETWLGNKVLDRSTKRPALTETGRILFDGVAPHLERIAQVASALRRRALANVVVVSAPAAFVSFRVLPVLADFWHQHPDLEVDFRFARFDAEIDFSTVDVAIRFLHEDSEAVRLGSKGWSAVSTPSYHREIKSPSSLTELGSGALLHEEIYNFWPEVFRHSGLPVPSNTLFQGVGDAHHVLSTLLSGYGAALLPNELTAGLRRAGSLVKMFDVSIEPEAGYFAKTARPEVSNAGVDALLNWLQRRI